MRTLNTYFVDKITEKGRIRINISYIQHEKNTHDIMLDPCFKIIYSNWIKKGKKCSCGT